MATQAFRHSDTAVATAATQTPAIRRSPAWTMRTVLFTLGVLAIWAAAVFGFQQLMEHAFGFPRMDAWALALGVIGYLAFFIVVMVVIVASVRHADEDYLAREERAMRGAPHDGGH